MDTIRKQIDLMVQNTPQLKNQTLATVSYPPKGCVPDFLEINTQNPPKDCVIGTAPTPKPMDLKMDKSAQRKNRKSNVFH
jgi:hypothetical protein